MRNMSKQKLSVACITTNNHKVAAKQHYHGCFQHKHDIFSLCFINGR